MTPAEGPSNANGRNNIGHSGVKINCRDNRNIKVSNITRDASIANRKVSVKKFCKKFKIRSSLIIIFLPINLVAFR
jgi:hypothetical protein